MNWSSPGMRSWTMIDSRYPAPRMVVSSSCRSSGVSTVWTLFLPGNSMRFHSETSAGLAITGKAKGTSRSAGSSSARSTTSVPG